MITPAELNSAVSDWASEVGSLAGTVTLQYRTAAITDPSLPVTGSPDELDLTGYVVLETARQYQMEERPSDPDWDEVTLLVADLVFTTAGWSQTTTQTRLDDKRSRIIYNGATHMITTPKLMSNFFPQWRVKIKRLQAS